MITPSRVGPLTIVSFSPPEWAFARSQNQGATLPAGGIKVKRMSLGPVTCQKARGVGHKYGDGCVAPPKKEGEDSAFPVLTVL